MLKTMNHTAAALATEPNSGAKVGPSTWARTDGSPLPPIVPAPSTPSHTTGSTRKYSVAIQALAYMARGTFLSGSTVSPTWQAAASKAGAAKPIRYSPAMALVRPPNTPPKGDFSRNDAAWCQSTWPVTTGMIPDRKASAAEQPAMTTATRVTTFIPASRVSVSISPVMKSPTHWMPSPA